ncbi:MAG TPA: signal peptidase II [Hyphomicrobiaceae bacterium]|nr:signal peptidase II [Hyphomicrobiaceae bacterium]
MTVPGTEADRMSPSDAADHVDAPGASRRDMALGRLVALATAPVVLIADVASKGAAQSALEPGAAVAIVGNVLQLRLGFNSGVAFGMLANSGDLVVWLTALIGIALTVWLVRLFRSGAGWRRTLPLGLIIGGAFGNVLDRLPDGLVTDFIDTGLGAMRWPSFNIADSAIVVGVLALIVFGQEGPKAREAEGKSRPGAEG